MAEFAGRRIVVTGGAGGIGVETARTLLDHGAHLVLVDIDEERLQQARETLGTARIATLCSAIDTPEGCAAALDSAGGPVFGGAVLAPLTQLFLEVLEHRSSSRPIYFREASLTLRRPARVTRSDCLLALDEALQGAGPVRAPQLA